MFVSETFNNRGIMIEELAKIRPSSTMLSVIGYRTSSGELADYQIAFHMSYANALKKSIAAVESYTPTNDLEIRAQSEVLESYKASLLKVQTEPLEVIGDHYERVIVEGSPVKGIKVHSESGKLHLFGLLVYKRVRETGVFKPTNKQPLTVIKDQLRAMGPVGRFRQFIIAPENVEKISVERMTLVPE